MNINNIKLYKNNAKVHSNNQIKMLANIIKEVGWRQQVLINKDNTIIVGHGRMQTYLKYKDILKPIWIINTEGKTVNGESETTPMTDNQEKAYRLADNKINESIWDIDLFDIELDAIKDIMCNSIDIKLSELIQDDEQEFQGSSVDNINNEYIGMPEYINNDLSAKRRIIVSFKNDADVDKFAQAIKCAISPKTKSIWFPLVPNERVSHKSYV